MRSSLPIALGAMLCVACSDASAPDPGPQAGECRGAGDFQSCLPSWQQYAPLASEQAPTASGAAVVQETTMPLERIDTTGTTVAIGNTTFVCTDQTFNFVDNPDRAVSFNIDETVIWPGALVQGRTHKEGNAIGALEALPIAERAPVTLTLSFNNQDNTRIVDAPNSGTVASAKGSMIGNAEAEGLATSNNIEFVAETFSSEKQAALAFGFSGRYLSFEAKASGSLSRSATTNTVAAKFVQQMYIASAAQPPTPRAFFSDAFTDAVYKQHESLQQVGPANPPLYVSRVGYGRMMVFAMTAKAEKTDMQAALDVAWRGVGASAGAELDARQSAILQQSEIRITQIGGDQNNALAAIRSGRLGDYFTDRAPLTSAAPIWFELKSLTGQVALVSEPGTYTETTCVPRLPGTFDYQAEAALAVPFTSGTQRQVVQADVNDDDRMDLVFNERRSGASAGVSLNRVHVALGQAGGGFAVQNAANNDSIPSEGWENYQLLVADVDGDGRDDLVWNHRGTNNVVYVGMSTGAGAFEFGKRQVHANNGWGNFAVSTVDLNGDGRTDLVWNSVGGGTVTRTYFGLAQPDTTFGMISNFVDRSGDFRPYATARPGRFNGDAYGDFALNALSSTRNDTHLARFTPTSATGGTLSWSVYSRSEDGWGDYRLLIGNVDGQGADDLVWVNATDSTARIYRALNNGSGTAFADPTSSRFQDEKFVPGRTAYLGDFNDDGRADVLLNALNASENKLMVGFGSSTGRFSFPAGIQSHPATPTSGWAAYDQVFVGDVNGDGKADIVWTSPASDARVFVALAK